MKSKYVFCSGFKVKQLSLGLSYKNKSSVQIIPWGSCWFSLVSSQFQLHLRPTRSTQQGWAKYESTEIITLWPKCYPHSHSTHPHFQKENSASSLCFTSSFSGHSASSELGPNPAKPAFSEFSFMQSATWLEAALPLVSYPQNSLHVLNLMFLTQKNLVCQVK